MKRIRIDEEVRVRYILPQEDTCPCGDTIIWEEGEPADKFSKRHNIWLKAHNHERR